MIPALVVPVLNRPDLLDRLLDSIDYPVGDLLIIDNGDVVRHRPEVEQAGQVHLIKSPSNLGVPGSWNLGVKMLPFAPYWLVVNSDACFPAGALEQLHVAARSDALVLSAAAPPWACFILGDAVVATVGLFDEGIHPAYFEDNDYERRCTFHGFPVVYSGVRIDHANSSTIGESRYAQANGRTFQANRAYYEDKMHRGDMDEGRWSLTTRRDLSWD